MKKIYSSFYVILFCLSTSCISKSASNSKIDNENALQELLEDYHNRFGVHRGFQGYDSPLEINMCFFQRDTTCYVALTGWKQSGEPCDLCFFWSPEGGVRKDMLGYCSFSGDGLGVYNSIKEEKSKVANIFLRDLVPDMEVAKEKFKDMYNYMKEVSPEINYYQCVYQISSCGSFSLVDSGYYYQLKYTDFMRDDWLDSIR